MLSAWICWKKLLRQWGAAPLVSSTLPSSPGVRPPCLSILTATLTLNWKTCREPVRGNQFQSVMNISRTTLNWFGDMSACFWLAGSFKIRGVANQFARRPEVGHFVTMSAGNYGKTFAYALKHYGSKGKVVMPETAPLSRATLIQVRDHLNSHSQGKCVFTTLPTENVTLELRAFFQDIKWHYAFLRHFVY